MLYNDKEFRIIKLDKLLTNLDLSGTIKFLLNHFLSTNYPLSKFYIYFEASLKVKKEK